MDIDRSKMGYIEKGAKMTKPLNCFLIVTYIIMLTLVIISKRM